MLVREFNQTAAALYCLPPTVDLVREAIVEPLDLFDPDLGTAKGLEGVVEGCCDCKLRAVAPPCLRLRILQALAEPSVGQYLFVKPIAPEASASVALR